MAYEELKQRVWRANLDLVEAGLVLLTWGNASEADREAGVFAIKPSGVDYATMRPEDMVVVSIETGEKVEGDCRPSSDMPTHRHLYREFEGCGGVVHTHSTHATAWAQAYRDIPCLGTTHADQFHGSVPLTRQLTDPEVRDDYELNTGRVIVERYREKGVDPMHAPAVLVAGHGPFAWGANAAKAVENAIVLEEVAKMAMMTEQLNPRIEPIKRTLLDKHFLRKHGKEAYYGQPDEG